MPVLILKRGTFVTTDPYELPHGLRDLYVRRYLQQLLTYIHEPLGPYPCEWLWVLWDPRGGPSHRVPLHLHTARSMNAHRGHWTGDKGQSFASWPSGPESVSQD